MHELSVALSLIDLAEEEATRRGSTRVEALYLKLGPLSGVVKEALLFSFEIACEGTMLAGSRLIIEEVPVEAYCPACGKDVALDSIQAFCCPLCGGFTPDVVQGKELDFVAMELS